MPRTHYTSGRTVRKSNCLHLKATKKPQKEIYGASKLKEGCELYK